MKINDVIVSLFLVLLSIDTFSQDFQETRAIGLAMLEEGVISTGDYESHPAFTITEDTLYFLKCAPDLSTWTICVSYKERGKWSIPVIAPFSGQYMDGDPFISKNGKDLYFVSNRPLIGDTPKADLDIWKMTREGIGWGRPVRLPEPVNSPEDEYYPTISDSGTLYFGSKRNGGNSDIYRAPLVGDRYPNAQNLGKAINTLNNEYEPFIAPDESYIIYMATSPNGLGNADLYFSFYRNQKWAKPIKLPVPINSDGTEWSPKVSRDGHWFYFGSTRSRINETKRQETTTEMNVRLHSAGNGLSDIYRIEFSTIMNEMNNKQ